MGHNKKTSRRKSPKIIVSRLRNQLRKAKTNRTLNTGSRVQFRRQGSCSQTAVSDSFCSSRADPMSQELYYHPPPKPCPQETPAQNDFGGGGGFIKRTLTLGSWAAPVIVQLRVLQDLGEYWSSFFCLWSLRRASECLKAGFGLTSDNLASSF